MATSQEVDVRLRLRDEASRKFKGAMKGMEKQSKSFSAQLKKNWIGITAAVTAATVAYVKFMKTSIDAASSVEQMNVKLTQLLGSVEEGNKVFADMTELAGRVPKTYEEIMTASTQLAGVVRNGSQEIKDLMPIIVDISAGTGMSVQEVTGQIIRMYSAGAAAADMFRERGISAALGFEAGASVSAKDTMAQIIGQWEDGTSKFAGASDKLAETWEGRLSMMSDAWFKFRSEIGKSIIENKSVIDFMQRLTSGIREAAEMLERLGQTESSDAAMDKLVNNFREAKTELEGLVEGLNDPMLQDTTAWEDQADMVGLQVEKVQELQQEITNLAAYMAEEGELIGGNALDLVKPEYIERIRQLNTELLQTQAQMKKTVPVVQKVQKETTKESTERIKNERLKQKQYIQSANTFAQATIQGLQLAQGESKKYAGVIKAIRIGEAIMNTAAGITNAFATAGNVYVGIAMAAAVAALGAVQIATIASQPFAQGTDNVPAMLSSGEMVVPRTFASSIRSGDLSLSGKEGGGGDNNVTVIMESASFNSDQDIDEVFEDFSEMLFERRRAN